ncbi:meiotic recombination protein REC114 [Acipenser ruthenus]|uniref:meiotic recombination protein REC114 n=1 Tax=Acipenser ruthenus TaxID=7906 RepID=UPI0027411144|nr:meiotic recombination protein REC114 [Acipenser ruthenus]
MAEAPGGSGTVFGTRSSTAPALASLLWHLKRYARFLPSETRVERDTGAEHKSSWKVFESGAEGQLTLTIIQSGHFLISQGQGLLEGFSLIDAPSFLKVVRKADLLLFSLKIKNESRMFRMQFGGGSREQAVEHCGSAVLTLQQYVTVKSQDTGQPTQGTDLAGGAGSTSEVRDSEGRLPIKCLAQSLLGESKLSLPLAYRHFTLPSEELGPFLRLCLLDQSFPAFVEQVEKELHKIANE